MSETEPSHHLDIVREVLYTEKKNVKHTFSIKLSAVKIHMLVIILYIHRVHSLPKTACKNIDLLMLAMKHYIN